MTRSSLYLLILVLLERIPKQTELTWRATILKKVEKGPRVFQRATGVTHTTKLKKFVSHEICGIV